MSEIFAGATAASLKAFWYHFAIMFEALFILTTVDAGTRVGRFMLQDTLGNVWKPIGRVSWKPGLWATSAVVVAAWGYFLYTGVTNPLGGINQLFPLFGIANQLLAAVALTLATTLLIKAGKLKWAWVTGIPLAWDAAVTLTASYQKVFSGDPMIGFFAQRDRYKDALDAGEVLPPATNMDDMQAVVTNSTVDGVLAALFAAMIIIVILDASRVWFKAIRAREPLPSTEAEYVESKIVAPAALFPTAEERAVLPARAPATAVSRARSGRRRARAVSHDREAGVRRCPLVPARGVRRVGLRSLRRAHAARASGPAGDVAARLRAPPAGRARGEPSRALLLMPAFSVSFAHARCFAMAERKPAKKGARQSAKNTSGTASKGFTAEERAAMRERSKELKAVARRGGKADGESDVLAKIAEMPEPDRAMAERLHALITASAPALAPRTWYGMPAYAKDGNVVCFFQSAQKFKARYATLGFSDKANLDEGTMWPTSFALTDLTAAEEARIAALVKQAVS